MIKDRDLVIPGEFLGEYEGTEYATCHFKEEGKLFSSVSGMVRKQGGRVKVIPSKGTYTPKEEDVVVGVIIESHYKRWHLDINSPYECIIFGKSMIGERDRERREPQNFEAGDIVSVKISRVDEVNFSEAIKPWKLEKGLIIEVNPKRVPRVIVKKRSILDLIKRETDCKIIVGQNGRIWIKGGKEKLVVDVINKIIKEAQTPGLTNRIKELLDKEKRK